MGGPQPFRPVTAGSRSWGEGTKSVVYAPTHVNPPPVTPPPSAVSATCADDPLFSMLLVVPVIDEFRISAVDDALLYTP